MPELKVKLSADKAYQKLLSDAGQRGLFLVFATAVSEMVGTSDTGSNAELTEPLADPLQKKGLLDAAVLLFGIHLRTGAFPPEFEERVKAYLAGSAGEPNAGLWKPAASAPPHDITALAVLMNPSDPAILRERLAAKRLGPFKWSIDGAKTYVRPYMVRERDAIERLAALTVLQPAEASRLEFVRLGKVGDTFRLGEFSYQVTGLRTGGEIGNTVVNAKATDGAIYIVVDYTIENLGNKTATVAADDFRLLDLKGREFSPSSEGNTALAMSGKSKDLILAQVQPGLRKKMATAFEVPLDVTKEWFKLVVPEKGVGTTGRVVLGVEVSDQ